MENDFPSEKKSKYQERTSNKRYLKKKSMYRDKVAWIGLQNRSTPDVFIKRMDDDVWRISEIRQTISWKLLLCISENWVQNIQLSFNNKLIDSVVIGDYVSLQKSEISGIIERVNLLARHKGDSNRLSLHTRVIQPIAANLDYVVVVASAKDPKFQPWFIDRYMVLAEESRISPIICITKSDLLPIEDPILEWYEKKLKIPVIHTSSVTGMGIDGLRSILEWKTVVFVWKSGVGKSSLTNSLLGNEIITTSHVSVKWGQWRHTTTTSKMHEWKEKSYVIDTPGIRSLEFLEFNKEELKLYFPEFKGYSQYCRFGDCNHSTEPDCGVKDAVKSGVIPEFRYHTYVRLISEIA